MFRIERHEVPIEIRALRTANVYEIFGRKRIMVDSGMSEASYRELAAQGMEFGNIDTIFLTHLHIDHLGSAHRIQQEFGVKVAMHKDDIRRVEEIRESPEDFRDSLLDIMRLNGTPPTIIGEMVKHHSVLDHLDTYIRIEFDISLEGGEEIAPGIKVIHNPGHSPGSSSLYIREESSIFTGDHILPGITPNISFYDDSTDMLGMYLNSLKETRSLRARTVYPGHREPFTNANARIDQIISHHENRMNEIAGIAQEWKTAYEIAESMKWSRDRTISSMNLLEMNFAIGEAISHLMHMEAEGRVERRLMGEKYQYRAISR